MKTIKVLCIISVITTILFTGCTRKVANNTNPKTSHTISTSKNQDNSIDKNSTDVNNSEGASTSVPSDTTSSSNLEVKSNEDAVNKVLKVLKQLPENHKLSFDHMDTREGKTYYVIHYFEDIKDNPDTGEGHSSTVAWYYVEQQTGAVYLWDTAEDKLNVIS